MSRYTVDWVRPIGRDHWSNCVRKTLTKQAFAFAIQQRAHPVIIPDELLALGSGAAIHRRLRIWHLLNINIGTAKLRYRGVQDDLRFYPNDYITWFNSTNKEPFVRLPPPPPPSPSMLVPRFPDSTLAIWKIDGTIVPGYRIELPHLTVYWEMHDHDWPMPYRLTLLLPVTDLSNLRVIAEDSRCPCHPHVNDMGELCLGDAYSPVKSMLDHERLTYDPVASIGYIMSVLETYNEDSPYYKLGELDDKAPSEGFECADCGDYIDEDRGYWTVNDGHICEPCSENYYSCERCSGMVYNEDSITIHGRQGYSHEYCRPCSRRFEHECCADCGDRYMTSCLEVGANDDLYCPECIASNPKDEPDESDD